MENDGWIFEKDSCHFDASIGFAAEWRAMQTPFAIVDLETTGGDPESSEILEFSAITVSPSGLIESEFSMLLRNTTPVPEWVLNATGISCDEIDNQGLQFSDAWRAFLCFLGQRPVFINHASFDKAFLENASERTGTPFHNVVHDTSHIFFMTWTPSHACTIEKLCPYIDYTITGNRALDDAKAVRALLVAARDMAQSR